MRRTPRSRRPQLAVERLEAKQLLALTFLVTTTADSGPGSLRQAILDLDAAPTTSYPSDTINFAIPGTGTHTIAPLTPLPVITNPANIDGYSQPGYDLASYNSNYLAFPPPAPAIVLDGVNAVAAGGGPVAGLSVRAPDTVSILSLEIIRFSGAGVSIDGSRSGDGNNVADCYIGTDGVDGQHLGNGGDGVRFVNPSYYNHVTNNVIEYNSLQGVEYPTAPPASFGPTSFVTVEGGDVDHNNTGATMVQVAPSDDDFEVVEPGSTRTLTYTVTNSGAIAASDVSVALSLGESSGFLTVASTATTVGTIAAGDGSAAGPFATATLGTLAPGDSVTITVVVQVDPAATGLDHTIVTAAATSPQIDAGAPGASGTYTIQVPARDQATATGPPDEILTTAAPGSDDATSTTDEVPITTTTDASNPGSGVITGTLPFFPAISAPADLAVTSTAPTGTRVGAATLFRFVVRNVGSGDAGDAVAAVDLAGVPANSFYAILSQGGGGGSGTLTPLYGRLGFYLVDLGPLAAGASATVAIMVMPAAAGPLTVAVAAADAANPPADPNPVDNLAYAGTVVIPKGVPVALTSSSTTPVASGSTAPRPTTSGAPAGQVATETVSVAPRSAGTAAARHRVALRLAHSSAVGVAQALPTTNPATNDHAGVTSTRLARGR